MKTLMELDGFSIVTEHDEFRPNHWIQHGCVEYDKTHLEEWGEEDHSEMLDKREVVEWGRCAYCEEHVPEPLKTLLILLEPDEWYALVEEVESRPERWEDRKG